MFTVYKASAGSGKTTSLVAEYLSICMENPSHFRNILAITFTNNATAEMKSRILETLHQFAFRDITDYQGSTTAIYEMIRKNHPEKIANIKAWAESLLEQIHYDYNNFTISTIDSFFQRVLRAFAQELGLNLNFKLEIQLDDFYQQSIDGLLSKISANNKAITKRVLNLVEDTMISSGKWKIDKQLLSVLKELYDENAQLPIASIKKALEKNSNLFVDAKNWRYKQDVNDKELQKDLNFLFKNITHLELLFDLKQIMERIKEEDQLFYLSETNQVIQDNIKDSDTPFIFEKLGQKYRYFFIDEFQDTSFLQWSNLKPLLHNALSQENGKVFLMGDVKQAIYRFRNGDSSLMHSLADPTEFVDIFDNKLDKAQHKVIPLDTNYRSGRNITTFNNHFFKFLTEGTTDFECCKPFYQDVIQKCKEGPEGLVSVSFKPLNEKDTSLFLQKKTLEQVKDALERGYSYRDIAVLTSGNKQGKEIALYLTRHEIPVISNDSILLNASPEVNLIIASLQYIYNKKDTIKQVTILQYYCATHQQNLSNFTSYLQELNSWKDLFTIYKNELTQLDNIEEFPIYTAIKQLLLFFEFNQPNPFITLLLDCVQKMGEEQSGDWSYFFNWWEERGATQALSVSPNMDAVTITSVHKSKGLAYPVVIFPFSELSNFLTKPSTWVKSPDDEDELEIPYFQVNLNAEIPEQYINSDYNPEKTKTRLDGLNKLYVAHTRPVHELHIITTSIKRGQYAKSLIKFILYHTPKNANEQEINDFEASLNFYFHNLKWSINKPNCPAITRNKNSHTLTLESQYYSQFTQNNNSLIYRGFIEENEQQKIGIFIHDFLSKLKYFPKSIEEIEEITREVVEEYQANLREALIHLLENKKLQELMREATQIWNEQALITQNGEVLRPDKIVKTALKTVVIDFKTGDERTEHQSQINNYCQILEEMGFTPIEPMLIYV